MGQKMGSSRSAAAIAESVFSSQIFTNRSKVLPWTELVRLKVNAVARAAATAPNTRAASAKYRVEKGILR